MKNKIVSLLTAVIMMMTIFAVPMTSAASSTESKPEAVTTGSEMESDLVETEEEADVNSEAVTYNTENIAVQSEDESDDVTPPEPEKISIANATITTSQFNYGYEKGAAITPAVTVKVNGVTLVKNTDYTVKYSNNYYPGQATITITGINKYKGTATKTFNISKPEGMSWKACTTSSITIDWLSNKNVDGYCVYRWNYSQKKWTYIKTVNTSEATLYGLSSGEGYAVCVTALVRINGKLYESRPSSEIIVPTKPKKTAVTKITNHPALYAWIYWNKSNCTGYQVMMARNSTYTKNVTTMNVTSSTQLSRKISQLADNQAYYVKVRPYKSIAGKTTYGAWSGNNKFTTDGTRWYKAEGRQYYYVKGKAATGTWKFGKDQYYFDSTGAWVGASSTMWNKVKNSTSNTKYLIAVSRQLNRICVYEGSQGNWKLRSYWMCSTGAPIKNSISKTPTGSWLMPKEENHLGYIGGHIHYTCWYATRFYGRCFFHSVLYEPGSKKNIQDGRLGKNISDGCIRMNIDDAKWIYDNCHAGTRVIVY